jgi:hypothetical protein
LGVGVEPFPFFSDGQISLVTRQQQSANLG